MLFLLSVSALFFLIILVTTIGRRVTDFLPSPLKESSAFYIAPLLGLASLVLISTVYGWLSPFKIYISVSIFIGLMALGVLFEKERLTLFRDCGIICVFGFIVTLPIFASAIWFDSFKPFTDVFTYLVHGQWLQQHAFSQSVHPSGFFPAETQIVLYQSRGHRMGASFFLAFVQSLFHLEWSYYALLPTVGVVFAVANLALGGIIRQVLPAVSKTICLAICTLPAFSMNGFVYGAQWGFFPQTFGLAFCFGLASLIPGLVNNTIQLKPVWIKQFYNLLPLSICFSAFLMTYNDMFPLLGASIILFFFLMGALYWEERGNLWRFILIFVAEVSLVVNIEVFRIVKNFIGTVLGAGSGMVAFGWPVLWHPIQFLALSFGMKSAFIHGVIGKHTYSSDPSTIQFANINGVFLIDKIISLWVFPALLIMMGIILFKILQERSKNNTILFILCINIVFCLVFIKFRYATLGLNPGEMGHTFLQFKLSKWLTPFNLGLLGIIIAWLLLKTGKRVEIFKYIFLILFVMGMAIQCIIVPRLFIKQFQDETLQKYSSFNVLLDLRARVESIPKTQVIYLNLGATHYKLRQMVAYVLLDRRLASNYNDDGYILGHLPQDQRDMPIETADWVVEYKPVQSMDENPLNRVGPFFIRQAQFASKV